MGEQGVQGSSRVRADGARGARLDGKVDNSSRYTAYKKGGLARRALLYHMITYPFSDDQLKWVLDEIFSHFAPTTQLQHRHSDFVWKVILAEAFIRIYQDHFGIGSKAEA